MNNLIKIIFEFMFVEIRLISKQKKIRLQKYWFTFLVNCFINSMRRLKFSELRKTCQILQFFYIYFYRVLKTTSLVPNEEAVRWKCWKEDDSKFRNLGIGEVLVSTSLTLIIQTSQNFGSLRSNGCLFTFVFVLRNCAHNILK